MQHRAGVRPEVCAPLADVYRTIRPQDALLGSACEEVAAAAAGVLPARTVGEILDSGVPIFWVLDRWYFEQEFRVCPEQERVPLQALWTRTTPPYALCIPADMSTLSLNIRVTGRWPECEELAAWADRACDAGELVVDVGAAYGFCSMLLAARGFRVVALDANPWHAALVRGSAALNGLRVQVPFAAFAHVCLTAIPEISIFH